MPDLLPGTQRGSLPLSPAASRTASWSSRKRVVFLVCSASLLWYVILRLAVAV